jgi:hypothetical protein
MAWAMATARRGGDERVRSGARVPIAIGVARASRRAKMKVAGLQDCKPPYVPDVARSTRRAPSGAAGVPRSCALVRRAAARRPRPRAGADRGAVRGRTVRTPARDRDRACDGRARGIVRVAVH